MAKKHHFRALSKALNLRPIRAEDHPFLQQLYASSRIDIQQAPLPPTHKELLLQHQFNAQHDHYQKFFPDADFSIVLFRKKVVGRLYIDRPPTEIRVVDITLLPQYHNQGIGTFLLQSILEEGKAQRKKVVLHVEQNNPALKWYERLGFKKQKEVGTRFFMEWTI